VQSNSDFIVIGAGIAGASAAYELSRHGTVVVLEQEAVVGYHTTGRSAALYTEAWEKGLWRTLTIAARPFLEAPPTGFVEHAILTSLPVLLIGRRDQRGLIEELAADAGHRVETLDGATAEQRCPLLRPGYVDAALFESGSRAIDVDALHHGYLRGAGRRGGRVYLSHRVEKLERRRNGWSVHVDGNVFRAPVVVNAAGAWCDSVARMAGVAPVGLVPKRRTAFTFPAPSGISLQGTPMVIDVAEQFYFKPEAGQLLGSLAESTPMEPHDVRPEEIDVALAIDRIQAATTLDIRHVSRTWAGLRSFVDDRLPVVGEDPDNPGFYWLAGQGGAGIMTSPALGRAVAGLVTDGDLPADMKELGIEDSALAPGRLHTKKNPPPAGSNA
jgi:D-arginine dehydrogenase